MNTDFDSFDFDEKIARGIKDARFEYCMPVQARCFEEVIKNGHDVTVQSQTGTGKTAAFLLSVFQLFVSGKVAKKKALVIVPTRELAVQVEDEAILLGKYLDLKIGSFYGGVGYQPQEKMLRDGVDIAIGTPGRLIDYGQKGKLNFREFGVVIIDEADRLFDMGFLPDLRKMIRMLAPLEERRTMLFSATLSVKVQNLAWEYMQQPVNIEIEPEHITVDEIRQSLYHVSKTEKFSLLLGILEKEKPNTAIVFANTKHIVVQIAKRLEVNGICCEFIMGDLPQKKRLSIIDSLKKGELKFLVATDVAARGLHIDDLSMVINYDIPEDPENYVHRIGRTARAGRSGKAVTFACESYVFGLEAVEALIGMKIPVDWASEDMYAEDKSKGMRFENEYDKRPRRDGRDRPFGRSGGMRDRGRERDRGRSDSRRDRRPGAGTPAGPSAVRRTAYRTEKPGAADPLVRKDRGRDGRQQNRKPAPPTAGAPRKPVQNRPVHNKPAQNKPAQNKPFGNNTVHNKPVQGKPVPANAPRKGRTRDLKSRVEYYREKYGEDFIISDDVIRTEKKAKKRNGILGKIFGAFKKNKKTGE